MRERKSIISFDLDMTLLDHQDYRITPSALEAVERLRTDHRIVLASGRDMDSAYSRQFRDEIRPDGIIHLNGTKVTAGDERIYDHFMKPELVEALLAFARQNGLSVGATIDGIDYYTSPDTVREHDRKRWGEMNRRFGDPSQLLCRPVRTLAYIGGEEGVLLMEKAFPGVKFPMFAGKVGADVVEQEASKAEGLKRLCDFWGISMENTAAFGDSMNDLEIIQASAVGIAVGNAIPALKEAADYVTAPIREDGVLRACQHFHWFSCFVPHDEREKPDAEKMDGEKMDEERTDMEKLNGEKPVRITAYSCRPDEMALFEQFGKAYGVTLVLVREAPTLENADMAKGSQGVSIITTPVDEPLLRRWKECGVRIVSSRTVGYEHVDSAAAARLGIAVGNVSYTPNTVAEYTVMTMLMAVRRMKTIMMRFLGQDYSLRHVRGRELGRMTVGVVGTGRIGETVIRLLSGFGCRMLAYDLRPKAELAGAAEYVDLETLWKECDLITFHTPATEQSYHMVNRETLGKMRDGVVLINMARGSVIDTDALIEGLETGKVGAAALDVVEEEGKIYYRDFKYQPVGHHAMAVLSAMPNVLMTPHTAFFTDEAVSDMIEHSIKSCKEHILKQEGEEEQ